MLLTRQLICNRQLLQTESICSTNRYLSLLGCSPLPSASVLSDKGSLQRDAEIAALIDSESPASRQLRWMSKKWDYTARKNTSRSKSNPGQRTSGFRHTEDEEEGSASGSGWSWSKSWRYEEDESTSNQSKNSNNSSSGSSKGKSSNDSSGQSKAKKEQSKQTPSAFDILGVQEDAEDGEIRASYHRMARLHHPDLHPNDPKATVRFQEITTAYEKIKNKGARESYRFERQMASWTTEGGDATVIMDDGDESEEDEAALKAPARPISDVFDAVKVHAKANLDDIADMQLFFRWKQWQNLFLASWRVLKPAIKYSLPVLFFFKFPLIFKIWLGWMSLRFILMAVLSALTSPARVWNRLVSRFVKNADRRRRKL